MSDGHDAYDVSMPDLLLVEDNALHVRLVRSMLEEVWYGVGKLVHVTRIGAAIPYLADHTPECILLDLHLPDADGLTGLVQIRAVVPDIPIVVLSAHEDNDTAVSAIRNGAQDYLVKGDVTADGIARSIRFAIERSKRVLDTPVGSSRGAYAVCDDTGSIVLAADGFLEMAGRAADDVLDVHVASLWDDVGGTAVAEALSTLSRSGGGWSTVRASFVQPDGTSVPVAASIDRLDGGADEHGGFVIRVTHEIALPDSVAPVMVAPPA